MTSDSRPPEATSPPAKSDRISPLATEPIIGAGSTLGRIYQSLADFTVLTRLLRAAVDDRLASHLTVTGWHQGTLRVLLDQPALATRWRFQEPGVRRALANKPALSGLRDIRLVMTDVGQRVSTIPPADPVSLQVAPVAALRALADTEEHAALRASLLRLSDAADRARQEHSGAPASSRK